MVIPAQLEQNVRRGNRRGQSRRRIRLIAEGVEPITRATLIIHDLSESGLLIESTTDLSVGEPLSVKIPEAGEAEATIVWSSGNFFGGRFTKAISKAAVSAAVLQSPSTPHDSVTDLNPTPSEQRPEMWKESPDGPSDPFAALETSITAMEADILRVLRVTPGPISFRELTDKLASSGTPYTQKSIHVGIHHLRRKLAAAGVDAEIESFAGYRFRKPRGN